MGKSVVKYAGFAGRREGKLDQMERLTRRIKAFGRDNVAWCDHMDKGCEEDCEYCEHMHEMIEKLARYEEDEEHGLLVRLPCKVGDTVYTPTRNFVSELIIAKVILYRDTVFFGWNLISGIYPNLHGFPEREIGESVFLTREEAEKKLKEFGE